MKVKYSCPCKSHEATRVNGDTIPLIPNPHIIQVVSCQLHAPTSLSPLKEPLVPTFLLLTTPSINTCFLSDDGFLLCFYTMYQLNVPEFWNVSKSNYYKLRKTKRRPLIQSSLGFLHCVLVKYSKIQNVRESNHCMVQKPKRNKIIYSIRV